MSGQAGTGNALRIATAAVLMAAATPALAWNTSGIPTLLGAMLAPIALALLWARDKSGMVEFLEMLAATVLFGTIPLAICFALFYWIARGVRRAFERNAAATGTPTHVS